MSRALTESQIEAIASFERIDRALVKTISDAAVAHDLPPSFLLAVAKRETDFGRGSGYDAETGLGDRGNGYGIFQLDKNSVEHVPLLPLVQHDEARAADVAAGMLQESVRAGLSLGDAAHVYNSGRLSRPTTTGDFEGRSDVPYETAVMGWAREYDAAAHIEMTVDAQRTSDGRASVPATRHPRLLASGSHGADVAAAQRELGVVADGTFGQRTEEAVRAFQDRHGLRADGIIGNETRAALRRVHEEGAERRVAAGDGSANETKRRTASTDDPTGRDGAQAVAASHGAPSSSEHPEQPLVNERIFEAANALTGMSTRNAQTHDRDLQDGNVACAYAVNQVLDVALGRTYGANERSVLSVMTDLRQNGREIPADRARPGDIAIKLPGNGERHGHIGIVMDGGRILSNSSGRGSLTSLQDPAHFGRNDREHGAEDRVVYLRIDPATVDLAYVREHPVPPRERLLDDRKTPPHVGGWNEHRPQHPSPAGTARPRTGVAAEAVTDASRPHDAALHGESREGTIVKTAIGANLPADAKPEHVGPDDSRTWTPDMPAAAFERLLAKARGNSRTAADPPSTPARTAPERGIGNDR